MSTENIDTMGFEPAVEYDVPDFGKVHVLMKNDTPWFWGFELGQIVSQKKGCWITQWISKRMNMSYVAHITSSRAAQALLPGVKNYCPRGVKLVSAKGLGRMLKEGIPSKRENRKRLVPLFEWISKTFSTETELVPEVVEINRLGKALGCALKEVNYWADWAARSGSKIDELEWLQRDVREFMEFCFKDNPRVLGLCNNNCSLESVFRSWCAGYKASLAAK